MDRWLGGWLWWGTGRFPEERSIRSEPPRMCGGKDRTSERGYNSCVIWGKSYSIFYFCNMKLTKNICKSMMSHKTKKRSSGQQKRSANHHVGWWNMGKANGIILSPHLGPQFWPQKEAGEAQYREIGNWRVIRTWSQALIRVPALQVRAKHQLFSKRLCEQPLYKTSQVFALRSTFQKVSATLCI